jgi:regulator of replication initiation timing
MKQKKHTQIQRILRLENIVAQLYVQIEAIKLTLAKKDENKEINLEKNKGEVGKPSGDKQNKKQG